MAALAVHLSSSLNSHRSAHFLCLHFALAGHNNISTAQPIMKTILIAILALSGIVSAENYNNGRCTGENKHDCCNARKEFGINSARATRICDKYGCNRKTCFGYYENEDSYASGKQSYYEDDADDDWKSPTYEEDSYKSNNG